MTRSGAVVLVWFAVLAALLFCSTPVAAHDLAVDRLTLRPDRKLGTVRGQVTFDPALTRDPSERVLSAELEARAVAFIRENVALEVDGRPLAASLRLRELWVPAGAVPGDIVMLDAIFPSDAGALVVRVGKGFRALVVSVEEPRGVGPGEGLHSALVLGGNASPPYRFSGGLEASWKAGPPSQFDAVGLAHRAGPTGSAGADSRTVEGAEPGFERPSTLDVARQYVWLGVVHIVPRGLDHMLFVVGLVLGAGRNVRRLVLLLSLFTFAHTVSLALGALGWVALPGSVVEPLIALSIVFVGVENAVSLRRASTGAFNVPKYRPFVVLAFGLLHGLGFAGALAEAGIPRETFVVSLLSFNVGVELGQLAVAAVALGVVLLAARRPQAGATLALRGSLLIALVGLGWTFERLVS